MQRYANPARFMALSKTVLPYMWALSLLLISAGLLWGVCFAPPDYQQGESVRIMYIHVPAAWLGMFGYAFLAAMAALLLVWKHPLADMLAAASAPIGASFAFITLVTGSLWGKPTWGTYWVWDARLTSMLLLFFLYLGYMALDGAFRSTEREGKARAALALIGLANLPVIKFSVEWWSTLHQPASILRLSGPTIHPSMLWPLLLSIAGFTCLFLTLTLLRARTRLCAAKLHRLRQAALSSIEPAPL